MKIQNDMPNLDNFKPAGDAGEGREARGGDGANAAQDNGWKGSLAVCMGPEAMRDRFTDATSNPDAGGRGGSEAPSFAELPVRGEPGDMRDAEGAEIATFGNTAHPLDIFNNHQPIIHMENPNQRPVKSADIAELPQRGEPGDMRDAHGVEITTMGEMASNFDMKGMIDQIKAAGGMADTNPMPPMDINPADHYAGIADQFQQDMQQE